LTWRRIRLQRLSNPVFLISTHLHALGTCAIFSSRRCSSVWVASNSSVLAWGKMLIFLHHPASSTFHGPLLESAPSYFVFNLKSPGYVNWIGTWSLMKICYLCIH
jgi:hypothetical protein